MYGLTQPGAPVDGGWQVPLRTYTDKLARFNVEALVQNCSLLCLTDFVVVSSPPGKSALKKLLRKASNWAYKYGGYTKFFVTLNNHVHRRHTKDVLLEVGFKEVGEPYMNRRTNNIVQWYIGDINEIKTFLKGKKL